MRKRKPKTVTIPSCLAPVFLPPLVFPPGFRLTLVAVLALGLCASPLAFAGKGPSHRAEDQKAYALIFGTVWGPDNYPLYGVKVEIRRAGRKKPHWELYSDHNGEFAQRVPAGQADYLVWADLKGYKYHDGKHLRLETPVTVHIENDERADIGLHLTQ
jgi:hypothetical protein